MMKRLFTSFFILLIVNGLWAQTRPPVTDFSGTPTSGKVPLTVQFTDQSVGTDASISSWKWDFGDGNTSTSQNPSHTYSTYGKYTVSLTATDAYGIASTENKADYITANYGGPVWYVSNTGNDGNDGTKENPFKSIRTATVGSSAGDTVLISPGEYNGFYLDSDVDSIYIASTYYANLDSAKIREVIVGFVETSSYNNKNITIEGLTFSGTFNSSSTTGVEIKKGSGPIYLKNCHIVDNSYGVSQDDSNSQLSIDNCIISNNQYAGIYIRGNNGFPDLDITNTKIIGNNSSKASVGGGIHGPMNSDMHLSLTIKNSEISNNHNHDDDHNAALYISSNAPVDLDMDNVIINGNVGSGISARDIKKVDLNNVTITNNSQYGITYSSSAAQGSKRSYIDSSTISYNDKAGIYSVYNSSITNTSITYNGKSINAGTYHKYAAGGIDNMNGENILKNVKILNNRAAAFDGYGGGLSVSGYGRSDTLINVTIKNNFSRYGGGIYIYDPSPSRLVMSGTNIYENYGYFGTDIAVDATKDEKINIVVDTFTVNYLNDYHIYPVSKVNLTKSFHTVEIRTGDIYVSPDGNNSNAGTSAAPLKTIGYAMLSALGSSSAPVTINLTDGIFSPSTNGDYFPIGSKANTIIKGASQTGTILNGDSLFTVFYIKDNDFKISDLTIKNGDSKTTENESGGGVYIYASGFILDRILFENNYGLYNGGAIYTKFGGYIKNSILKNNQSKSLGAGIFAEIGNNQDLIIENTIITGNSASDDSDWNDGGGIYLTVPSADNQGSISLINSIITGNSINDTGGRKGGGISINSHLNVINSIITNNSPMQVEMSPAGQYNVNVINSNIENGKDGLHYNGTPEVTLTYDSILNVDPLFIDTAKADYNLKDQSLLIGAGIDSVEIRNTWYSAPSTDITGNKRPNPSGSKPDIGPHESIYGEPQHNTLIYVSTTGTDSESIFGFSSAPFKTIQAAVDYSVDGDTIIVKPGTYIENVEINQKNIVFGSLYFTSNDTSYISQTIIDGSNDLTRWGIDFQNNNSTFTGFTITKSGGVVARQGSTPKLSYLYMIDNSSQVGDGTGIFIEEASGTVELDNIKIIGTNGNKRGGGLRIYKSKALVKNSFIINNSAIKGGGIAVENNSELVIENTVINSNSSSQEGGGIWVEQSSKVTIKNCEISNNSSINNDGGGLYLSAMSIDESIINITNSTIVNNSTPNGTGGAAYITWGITIDISNSIFWGNTSGTLCDGSYTKSNFYTIGQSKTNIINIDYTDFENGKISGACFDQKHELTWGENNIDIDPLFSNVDNKDYKLTFFSPAIDKGNPDLDDDGASWVTDSDDQDPDGSRMDLGAYYFDKRDIEPPVVSLNGPIDNKLKLGKTYNITWSTTDNFPTDTIKIRLDYSTDYSSGNWLKIADSLANTGTYQWILPNIPSNNGGIKITATDFGGNTTSDSTSKEFEIHYPSVSLKSLEKTIYKISELISIGWTTASDPAVQLIDLYYTVDNGTTWKDLALNENNDGQYSWSAPNEPTSSAGLRIIAKDQQFGYTDTSDVMGLSFEIDYPKIISTVPVSDFIWWTNSQFDFVTNLLIDPASISKESVVITSSNANYKYAVTLIEDTVRVTFNDPLITYDTIQFKFDASKIKTQYGYALDGNRDGTPGDDYIKQKIVYLPIDYDLDRKIDSKDISLFIDYFKSNQSGRETAPVSSGKVPYITIDPDGKYDIDDMLTFVQFGNWYLEGAQGKILDDITNTPISLDSTIRSSIYQIPLLQSMQSIELYVSYDPLELEPLLNTINAEVKLSHHDSDNGLISMILYNPDQEHIDIKWKHLKESSESVVSLLLKTEYNDQSVQVQRSMFKIMSVPDEYVLHDNFPNPFNPTTTFKFDIPKESSARLNIYNILGQQVKTFHLSSLTPGYHSIIWDSTNDFGEQVSGGVYFYQLQSQDFMQTKKMILLK